MWQGIAFGNVEYIAEVRWSKSFTDPRQLGNGFENYKSNSLTHVWPLIALV